MFMVVSCNHSDSEHSSPKSNNKISKNEWPLKFGTYVHIEDNSALRPDSIKFTDKNTMIEKHNDYVEKFNLKAHSNTSTQTPYLPLSTEEIRSIFKDSTKFTVTFTTDDQKTTVYRYFFISKDKNYLYVEAKQGTDSNVVHSYGVYKYQE